jgi:hypothetical protein
MKLYDEQQTEIGSREFDVFPAYGNPGSCFTEFFQTGADGAKSFSIRAYFDDGCVADWETNKR